VSRAASALETSNAWEKIDLSGTLAEAKRRVVAEVESRKIKMALNDAAGNLGHAADILQMNFKELTSKLKELGID
jgi:DNA-binding NtrC family response regulator